MRQFSTKQKGLSATGYIILIALFTFFVAIALKLIPVYIEHYYVVHSMELLESEAITLRDDEIRSRLLKNFSINDVDSVSRQQVKVKRVDSKNLEVSVEYDVQKQLVGNIDVIIHFSNALKLKQ